MSDTTLAAEERTAFGKGAARAVRRAQKVPAVLYGHGQTPRHLTLPGHELMLALKHGGANALLTLKLSDGDQLALPKAVTRHPIKGFLEHVDLIVVRSGEKVTVEVPLTLTGETTSDVLITQPLNTLSVHAEATHIPTGFEFDVSELQAGATVTAGQVSLPQGVTLATDAEAIVISAQAAPTAEQLEAELGESLEQAAGEPTEGAAVPEGESAEGAAAESSTE
ncbi:MAG TPA: 50S ribosomal protein L25/general stress protein Ctc [Mycobacteriales bacterium]|nr:50S ribosomal protein L25/general stress protein Ctc [Mycobacteriales bacterium]